MGRTPTFLMSQRPPPFARGPTMMPRTFALTIAAVLTFSPVALADPVRIVTSGFYTVIWDEESDFRFIGTGFELRGVANDPGRTNPLFRCYPCAAGTSLGLSTDFTGSSYTEDSAIFEGLFYPDVYYTGSMTIRAGSVIVPDLADRAVLSAPFTASGFLAGYDNIAGTGALLFSTALSGRGTASVTFRNLHLPGIEGIHADSISYQFDDSAPIPEPATLLLVGSGLSAMYLRRRRRR